MLRLSDSVYGSTSVAAIGVAAHECGHAIQHDVGYAPLKLRSASVPVANIGSKLSWPLILIGLMLGNVGLARAGVFLFTFVVLFQLITLPVEFNASSRALTVLEQSGMLGGEELQGAGKVLKAAALTYVAALFSSILQLLRLFLLTQRNSRRRRLPVIGSGVLVIQGLPNFIDNQVFPFFVSYAKISMFRGKEMP